MSILPPTLIPNLEPTPLLSSGAWDQPDGLQPQERFSPATGAYIDGVELPNDELPDDDSMMEDFADAELSHIPPSRQHLAAPPPESMPEPSTLTIPARTARRTPRAIRPKFRTDVANLAPDPKNHQPL